VDAGPRSGDAPGGVPEWPIGTALKAVAGRDVSRGFESRPLCVNVYRIDRPAAAVTAGVLVVGAALAAFVAFLLTSVAATVVAVVLLVVAALLMLRPPVVARLDETGL